MSYTVPQGSIVLGLTAVYVGHPHCKKHYNPIQVMKTVASMKSTCPLHNLWYYSTREHAICEMDKRTEFINNVVSQ